MSSDQKFPVFSKGIVFCLAVAFSCAGCQSLIQTDTLARSLERPAANELTRGQLVIHSDFRVPRRHRLLDELSMRRHDVTSTLDIPASDEPIHVYLFEDQERFANYMKRRHPLFPSRRAFFVKDDTNLMVYAWWGNRVGEDLRHEITHGYLHSVLNDVPLWLDEGLAEYFETPRANRGFNSAHFHLLLKKYDANEWQPDLARLEVLKNATSLSQMDYAESWLWAHYLMHHSTQTLELLRGYVKDLRVQPANAGTLQQRLLASGKDDTELMSHLEFLRRQLAQ